MSNPSVCLLWHSYPGRLCHSWQRIGAWKTWWGTKDALCNSFTKNFCQALCTSSQQSSGDHSSVKIKMQLAGPSAGLTVYLLQYCSLENLLSLSWGRQLQKRGLNIYGTLKHRKITAYITICILFQGSKTQNCNRVWHILCGNEYWRSLCLKLEQRANAEVVTAVFCKLLSLCSFQSANTFRHSLAFLKVGK